jgi:hypothetical protein
MSAGRDADRSLVQALRAALGAIEPERVPPFGHVFVRAAAVAPPRRRTWALAAAGACAAATALVAWLALPPPAPAPDEDHRLALAVAASFGGGTPTDRWLDAAPSAPLSGLPALPRVEYPLIPEETLL